MTRGGGDVLVRVRTHGALAERYEVGDGLVTGQLQQHTVLGLTQVEQLSEEDLVLDRVEIDGEETRLERRAEHVALLYNTTYVTSRDGKETS